MFVVYKVHAHVQGIWQGRIYVCIPSFHLSVYALHLAHLEEIELHTNMREKRDREEMERERESNSPVP